MPRFKACLACASVTRCLCLQAGPRAAKRSPASGTPLPATPRFEACSHVCNSPFLSAGRLKRSPASSHSGSRGQPRGGPPPPATAASAVGREADLRFAVIREAVPRFRPRPLPRSAAKRFAAPRSAAKRPPLRNVRFLAPRTAAKAAAWRFCFVDLAAGAQRRRDFASWLADFAV